MMQAKKKGIKLATVNNATEAQMYEQALIHNLRWLSNGKWSGKISNEAGGGKR